jgi:hypothetical protein
LKTIYASALLTGTLLGLLFTGGLFFSWKQGIDFMVSFHKYYALLPVILVSILGAAFFIEQ